MAKVKCSCGKILKHTRKTSGVVQAHMRNNPTHFEVERYTFYPKEARNDNRQ